MSEVVREPIQTYLTAGERADIDRVARDLGVSRSEALRRGIQVLRRRGTSSTLAELMGDGLVTPATVGPGEPPPSAPVAPLETVLAGLDRDRDER